MEVINKLTAMLGGGACPSEFDGNRISKLA
jgi:hypothetical protein